MSKDNFKSVELKEARNHVDRMIKKKKDHKNAQIDRVERETSAYSTSESTKPPSEDYRDNYEKVFGHK